jgi:DNA-binding transcriptional regulator LsrR (DeoR family)
MILSRLKVFVQIAIIFSVLSISSFVESKKSSSSHKQQEPTIEEVTAKQLERILADKDYVAVYWCKTIKEQVLKNIYGKFKRK